MKKQIFSFSNQTCKSQFKHFGKQHIVSITCTMHTVNHVVPISNFLFFFLFVSTKKKLPRAGHKWKIIKKKKAYEREGYVYPVWDEYTFCSHLFPEKAMCLVFMTTTWSPISPGNKTYVCDKSAHSAWTLDISPCWGKWNLMVSKVLVLCY